MRENDYFTAEDMKRHGFAVWERVRAKLRTEGHEIIKGYGEYGRSCSDHHYIYLSRNGNLIHVTERPRGLQMDIAKYLGLDKVKAMKIRTGTDKEVIKQAFNFLVGHGFSDRNYHAIIKDKGKIAGIIGDTDGVIYSIITDDGFDNFYAHAEEIEFDTETKVILSNFRHKRKLIDLLGYTVDEDALTEWLKSNATKSAN